jgi:hypothetical protein
LNYLTKITYPYLVEISDDNVVHVCDDRRDKVQGVATGYRGER